MAISFEYGGECSRHVIHAAKGAARRAAREHRSRWRSGAFPCWKCWYGWPVSAYRCPEGDHWHWGHKRVEVTR